MVIALLLFVELKVVAAVSQQQQYTPPWRLSAHQVYVVNDGAGRQGPGLVREVGSGRPDDWRSAGRRDARKVQAKKIPGDSEDFFVAISAG
jgi:hypothetical protein